MTPEASAGQEAILFFLADDFIQVKNENKRVNNALILINYSFSPHDLEEHVCQVEN